MRQSLSILLAILLGLLLPAAHQLTFLVRYLLMVMLFFTYLPAPFRRESVDRRHLWVLLLNLLLPVLGYGLFAGWSPLIAQALFVTAVAPTAANTPVIAAMLGVEITFVTASALLTHLGIALTLPLILPLLSAGGAPVTVGEVLGPVALTVFSPLAAALLLRGLSPATARRLLRFRFVAFVLFVVNVFIASAQASAFIRRDTTTPPAILMTLVAVIGLLCLLQFQLGERLSSRDRRMQTSLALGRKNTMFGLWVGLTFLSPGAALGPVLYTIWQNLYNSWQVFRKGDG